MSLPVTDSRGVAALRQEPLDSGALVDDGLLFWFEATKSSMGFDPAAEVAVEEFEDWNLGEVHPVGFRELVACLKGRQDGGDGGQV